MSVILETAKVAAAAAVTIIREGYESVSHKGAVDLVTEVDLRAEEAIRRILSDRMPGVPILAEEGGGERESTTRWIVDPLDGTTNFVHGYGGYATSIAFQDSGTMQVGCIHDAFLDQRWWAVRGEGAFCEDKRLSVSVTQKLSGALLVTGFPYDRTERAPYYLRFVQEFLPNTHGVRRAGAASLDFCHLADGRLDGYWEFGLNPWDVAAGILLVEEAGGRVTDMDGSPISIDEPRLLATNGLVHEEMRTRLASLL